MRGSQFTAVAAGVGVLLVLTTAVLRVTPLTGTARPPPPGSYRVAGTPAARNPVTATQAALLERAEQELIRRCMAAAGFRYWPISRGPDPVPFRYVLDDVAWANRHGYGAALRQAAQERAAADPNRGYFASLPADRQQAAVAALNGPRPAGLTATLPNGFVAHHSDQGCESDAQRTLYGDLPAWYASTKLVENLAGERHGLVVSDSRLRAALPTWSACMRRAGYGFATPDEAHAGPPPGAGEQRRQAAAEARCAVSTGLGALVRRLDGEYAARQEQRHHAVLAARDAQQRRALPAAVELTAGH